MPSMNEVIERVGRVRPDAYDDKTKAGWLIELDGKLLREFLLKHRVTPGNAEPWGPPGTCPECGGIEIAYLPDIDGSRCLSCGWTNIPLAVKSYPEDGEKPLLVKPPYDNLYDLYLLAQIDFHNQETESYNNSALAFNQAMDEFKKEYHRTHLPITRGSWTGLF